jgi:hypothetical protein
MDLFRREWRVQVGTLDVSNFALKFKAKRTLAARAGTLDLEIRNLTEAHRREIQNARRFRTFVEVHAGYVGGMSLIFRGDLRKAVPAREGTDWLVKVTAGDGEHAIRSTRVSRSFAPGTTVTAVVTHLAEAMGVGIGNAREALRGASLGTAGLLGDTFAEGTVVYGNAAAELTRLCESARKTWSIQEGNLQILPLGGSLTRTAILLSPGTGMVGTPEVVSRRVITVKALLQPGLVPGQQVVVQSDALLSVAPWRITEAEYSGDTHGTDWYATLTCHRPRPPLVSGTTGATGTS